MKRFIFFVFLLTFLSACSTTSSTQTTQNSTEIDPEDQQLIESLLELESSDNTGEEVFKKDGEALIDTLIGTGAASKQTLEEMSPL